MVVYFCFVYILCWRMEDANKPTLSFGFTKRTEVKKLQSSAIKDSDHVKKEETDYLVSVEDKEIKRFVPRAIISSVYFTGNV